MHSSRTLRYGPALLLLVIASCADSRHVPARGDTLTLFDSAIDIRRELALDESDSVINVAITVRDDPAGGFLVTDARQAEVRSYDRTGELRFKFGGKGPGPGEFTRPVTAIRLSGGEILVLDRLSRAAYFSADGRELIRTIRTPFRLVQEADVINDSTLLVSGAAQYDGQHGLHVWHILSNRISASFFSPSISDAMQPAASAAGWPAAAVWGDTVAAVYSLSDTIYIYTLDGQAVRKIPFGSGVFRSATPMPNGMEHQDVARTWFQSFDLVHSIHRTRRNGLLVEYQTVDSVWTMLYGMMLFDERGRRIMQVPRSPKLLSVDLDHDSLYFIDPNSELPNRWAVGVLRRSH